MAPSFDIGKPQRSLVRIPDTGKDKTLKPICLEIAQIITFCESLTKIMKFDFNLPYEQATTGTINVDQRTPPPSSTSVSNREQHPSSRKRESEEQGGQALKRVAIKPPSIQGNAALSQKERLEKMKRLELEKAKLSEQNEKLGEKLALFRDTLRNRTKLNELLKTLIEISN